jgi:hypothetical protein
MRPQQQILLLILLLLLLLLVLPERNIASADASLDSAGRLIRGSPEREAMGPRGAETEAGEHRRNTDTD